MKIDAEELIQHALAARANAYAPYSKYAVGAAMVTTSGNTYLGCNVENASYGLTVCAERNAIFKAVSEEGPTVRAAALAVVTREGASMCGACRQVLSEFGSDVPVYLADADGAFRATSIEELLPGAFDKTSL